MNHKLAFIILTIWLIVLAVPASAEPVAAPGATITFAVIGDYGLAGTNELAVANRVKSWNPDFIITTGDNNYGYGGSGSGSAATIDQNIGQYYHDYIYPYIGSYGAGAATNKFFPTLGNHDWYTTDAIPYKNYFVLPNNERYYDFVKGPVHFFAVSSDRDYEPDGTSSTSTQGRWLQGKLAASTSCWKVVFTHHAPYSSGSSHGSSTWMQWPFQSWGAHVVLAGHEHNYERIIRNGFPYMVNGLGGDSRYPFGTPITGSVVRYNAKYGAQRVTASDNSITYEFIAADGTVADTYTQTQTCSNGGGTPIGGGNASFLPFVKR